MKFLRWGVLGLAAFGVLAFGGVEDWARAVVEVGAGILFVVWAVLIWRGEEHEIFISPLLPPLAGFTLVVVAQLVFSTTVSGFNTNQELTLLVADVVILFVAVQCFRSQEEWRGFVWFVMVFGFLVSVFGILQHLTFNGKLYWFRTMNFGGIPFGPYTNRNHFAGFVELCVPAALVPLMLGRVRRERILVVGLFAVVPIGALFLAASRGGIISFVAQLVVIVVWMTVRQKRSKRMLAGAAVLAAAVGMVSWLGVKEITQRFTEMKSLEVSSGKRAAMRADTFHIFTDHPWIGTGLGTLQMVFPPYDTLYDGRVVNHAHNDYLEALAETGFAGGLCCALFVGMLFFHSLRQLADNKTSFVAILNLSGLVACMGFLVHSLVDFNLRIPGNALLFFLMAAMATATISPALSTANGYTHGGRRLRKA